MGDEAKAGAWSAAQEPQPEPKSGIRLVSLDAERRVMHDDVPPEVVSFKSNNNGDRELVFDGVHCPKGVVMYQGRKCFLDGVPDAVQRREAEE